jgi:hypothetical protein
MPTGPFQLFDLTRDPFEQRDVSAREPEIVTQLAAVYDAWFADVTQTRGFEPLRIVVGAAAEPVTTLTRQDWRGPRADVGEGFWEIDVQRAGRYRIHIEFDPEPIARRLSLRIGTVERQLDVPPDGGVATLADLPLPAGPARFEAALTPASPGPDSPPPQGIRFAELERAGD